MASACEIADRVCFQHLIGTNEPWTFPVEIQTLTTVRSIACRARSRGEGKRVFIKTYGCQMNLADSELMGGILLEHGYTAAEELEDADVILINTCAVREKAEDRVFGRLSHLLAIQARQPGPRSWA